MENSEILENTESLLDSETLETLKQFAAEKKGSYVEFDPKNPDQHYYVCSNYSRDLQKILTEESKYRVSFLTIATKGELKAFGTTSPFPGKSLHSALVIEDLGIVIEPQNGKILFLDDSKPNNTRSYYAKSLGLKPEDLSFLITPDVRLRSESV